MPKKVDYSKLIGTKVNGKLITGLAKPSKSGRVRFYYTCHCGGKREALLQCIKKSNKCNNCAYKRERPYRRLRPYEYAYNNFRNRAKYNVEITYEQYYSIIKESSCHYCESALSVSMHGKENGTGHGLDRKDNNLPYTIYNVVPCCTRCNYGKNKYFSYEEWKVMARALANLQKEIEETKRND